MTLSTIHSAKGQEWKVVQVLNCIDGCMPSDMATGNADDIEEERRLLYVAMTRARDALTLLLPQRFYVHQQRAYGDRHVYAARSRFLTDDVCEHLLPGNLAPRIRPRRIASKPERPGVDLRAILRDVWTSKRRHAEGKS